MSDTHYINHTTSTVWTFTVSKEKAGKRLDVALSEYCPERTRSYLQGLIKDGGVLVNGGREKAGYKTTAGDVLSVTMPAPVPLEALPENIPLNILYEDDDILVVDKPKGMVVHPAAGHPTGTLVNAALYHCGNSLSGINGVLRPGIVHRIDRDTTGSLIICKNDAAHNAIAAQIKAHTVRRLYRGIVIGRVDLPVAPQNVFEGGAETTALRQRKNDADIWDESKFVGTVEGAIGRHPQNRKKMAMNVPNGKEAITHYRVLSHLTDPEKGQEFTYMEFRLETGRTHQIRVHTAGIGHPILGDYTYATSPAMRNLNQSYIDNYGLIGQTLHAMTIGFTHPTTGEYMEFSAEIPEYFKDLLEMFGYKE